MRPDVKLAKPPRLPRFCCEFSWSLLSEVRLGRLMAGSGIFSGRSGAPEARGVNLLAAVLLVVAVAHVLAVALLAVSPAVVNPTSTTGKPPPRPGGRCRPAGEGRQRQPAGRAGRCPVGAVLAVVLVSREARCRLSRQSSAPYSSTRGCSTAPAWCWTLPTCPASPPRHTKRRAFAATVQDGQSIDQGAGRRSYAAKRHAGRGSWGNVPRWAKHRPEQRSFVRHGVGRARARWWARCGVLLVLLDDLPPLDVAAGGVVALVVVSAARTLPGSMIPGRACGNGPVPCYRQCYFFLRRGHNRGTTGFQRNP
jgi:hypothetical protein